MTYSTLFPMLPDAARCWVYVAERRLTDAEQTALLEALQAFFEGWASHGRPVQGAATCLDDRFLVVAGTLTQEGTLSGCGIDASVHAVEEAAQRLGVTWASPLRIFYRDGDAVISLPRPTFKKCVADGTVTAETHVFDVSLTTLGQLRSGAFEQPAGASWHARVFRIPKPVA